MRPLDRLRSAFQRTRALDELRTLRTRLIRHQAEAEDRAASLVERVTEAVPEALRDPATELVMRLLGEDGAFLIPEIDVDARHGIAELWKLNGIVQRQLGYFEDQDKARLLEAALEAMLAALIEHLPPESLPDTAEEAMVGFRVPLHALMQAPAAAIEGLLRSIAAEELGPADLFPGLRSRLLGNLYAASGIDPERAETSRKPILLPTRATGKSPAELVAIYLAGTPFAAFLETGLPFHLPFSARFEHTHVVGGSGHGKTQLLQQLILGDLAALQKGKGSLVVIDSQGDMIGTITHLAAFSPHVPDSLADRLVLIDPNDVEHPPALNLFDFGLERLERYNPVEREKLINGAIALYEYMFGALLGAELTQRQGVIFRYLARLMMVVPGATIHTLRGFMEEPETTRPYFPALDPNARHFFETQFFSKAFDDTRQQILTRLWGILSNSVLARMFSHERNRLDMFEAMNSGKVILINTAKDLLKQEGCEILGRFFIAMIAQATQERAVIPADRRRATFLYVDEAQDYFDESIEQLLSQARKYKVGLILAHQNLDQLERRLLAAVMASTAIKLAGGMSAKDAVALAREMRSEPEFLQGMCKRRKHTEFACWVRGLTARPIRLTVPFGRMERLECMSDEEHGLLLTQNRARYCVAADGSMYPSQSRSQPAGSFTISEHELL